jgi:hypothetical protein
MNLLFRLLATGTLLSLATAAQAVTCSCASVPLLNSMEASAPDPDTWFVSYNYEFRDLGEAVQGSKTIDDGTDRVRTTESHIIEVSRGLSEQWSLSALLSYVRHKREIGGQDLQIGEGIGDGIIMTKYSPSQIRIYSRNAFSLGFGVRVPLGDDEQKNGFILLAEDLQPSTGSWAAIAWAYYAHTFSQAANLQFYSSLSHTQNFANDRGYQFGNEITLDVGASYQFNSPLGFIAGLRYRNSQRDQRDDVEVPNTGGEWLDFLPAVQYHLTQNLALKLGATIPIKRQLNDTIQFTTKRAATLSMSYIF